MSEPVASEVTQLVSIESIAAALKRGHLVAIHATKVGYQGYVVLEYEEEDPNKNVPEYIKLLRELIKES